MFLKLPVEKFWSFEKIRWPRSGQYSGLQKNLNMFRTRQRAPGDLSGLAGTALMGAEPHW